MMTSGEDDTINNFDHEPNLPESEISQNSNNESIQTPTIGMVFKNEDEVRTYYREYAYVVGFGTTKRSVRKKGGLQYFTLVCSRQGNCSSKSSLPRVTIGINCKAKINIKVSRNGEYEISKVELQHNHELSPGKSRRFRCNKRLDMNVQRTLELNDETGIRLNKTVNTHNVQAGGYDDLSFGQSVCRSYIRKVSQLTLGEGDANALQQYFCRMQKNQNFYYVMDISDEGQLRNVFWADARSRAAYEDFSDVISFDSTNLTNKCDIPFALFVGVNHHGHSILLGCALLSSEDTSTYIWLFKCWLDCMSGKAPIAIVTDECQAMHLAISEVFPHTQHRLCLWHIMKRIPEKFSSYVEYRQIRKTMKQIVYESLREDEFEVNWFEMVQKFKLQANEWLRSLYRCRNMWVPAYLKGYFWAGMSTTRRNESINAFFDGYVHKKTSLKQFVKEYDNALRCKVEKENQADFMSFARVLPFESDLHIEKQFQVVYTHEIFMKFQVELKGLFYCNATVVHVDGPVSSYEVTESVLAKDGNSRKEIKLQVTINEFEDTIVCLCSLFQFKGIICRHIIASMIKHHMNEIPEKYILSRWRKDIKRQHTLIKSSSDNFECTPQMQRYDELCKLSYGAAELASVTTDKFNLWKDYILNGKEKILGEVSCKSQKLLSPKKCQEIISKQKKKEKEVILQENFITESCLPEHDSQVVDNYIH